MIIGFERQPRFRFITTAAVILACLIPFVVIVLATYDIVTFARNNSQEKTETIIRPWFVRDRLTKHPTQGRLVWVPTRFPDSSGNFANVDTSSNVVLIEPEWSELSDYFTVPRDSKLPIVISTALPESISITVSKNALIAVAANGDISVYRVDDGNYASHFIDDITDTDPDTGNYRIVVRDFEQWFSDLDKSQFTLVYTGNIPPVNTQQIELIEGDKP